MKRIAGIILAAGESARMGKDKALLPWGRTTFLEHLLGVVCPSASHLRVVLGANAEAVLKKVRFFPEDTVINPDWQQGQLSSLIAALNTLPRDADAALVCLVDHPCISSAVIRALVAGFRKSEKLITLPAYGGRRGHPVVFSAQLFDELRAAPLEVGARHVVRRHAGDILEVPVEEEGVLLNINDRAAYEKILQTPPPD